MRLNSITTKNYRTLHNITIGFSNGYCTISGRNNAGKSSIIRLLSALFGTSNPYDWTVDESRFEYKEDKTQWEKNSDPIQVKYSLKITKDEDPALISFIEKIATKKIATESASLSMSYTIRENDEISVSVTIDGGNVDDKSAKEIEKRIKDSNLLFLYNSTAHHEDYYYRRGRRRMFYDFVMSEDEKKALDKAGKHIERRLRKLAKEHTQGLSEVLGRLIEKYDIEISPPEGLTARRMPLGINLRDRNVKVPLNDWGSGTQNRTHILMAILQANRIKTTDSPDEKITPFVVIEEPESFLHPSAQSEFGRMLRQLSDEFGIQIIATTHSPYMLNQEEPGSNLLLSREVRRGKTYETTLVDTKGSSWMAPFADHLGIGPSEFAALRPLFSATKSKVLLVEGITDQQYFELLKKNEISCEKLGSDIEVVPYGGKDTLKNTLLVQFVLRTFDKVFVTFDLDAESDVSGSLGRVGLKKNVDYLALGISQGGRDCIEGLLPERVLAVVNGKETGLVMSLGCKDNSDRRKAKDLLKKKYLEEFKSRTDYTGEELKELNKVVKQINSRLNIQQTASSGVKKRHH